MKRLLAALLVACVVLVAPAVGLGLGVTEVAQELRCVKCGTPLDVSNADIAQEMKAQIADRIAKGWTKQQIIDEFVQQFGPEVLATPKKRGFGLLAWLLPALAVLAGLTAIPFVTRAWAKRRPASSAAPAELSDEDRARVQRELDALDDD